MISLIGEITGDFLILDRVRVEPEEGFRRKVQVEKTLDGGAVVIDHGEDVAGEEIRIMIMEGTGDELRKADRLCKENNRVFVATKNGFFGGMPRTSVNGEIVIAIRERCA